MKEIQLFTEGSKNPKNIFTTFRHKMLFYRDNPDYFHPAGIWVFTGPQGSGKTLSMVQCLHKMVKEYPKAIVVSNLEIKGLNSPVIPFTDYRQLEEVTNDIYGVIFVIDEIHVVWSSMESRDIPITEMACFCQMRKDRRVILGTSQVYNRIAKPIREQLQYIIDCHNYASVFQVNNILDPSYSIEKDGRVEAPQLFSQWWFHTPELYDSYDTLKKISKANRIEEPKKGVKK